jgi:hypothetical protein
MAELRVAVNELTRTYREGDPDKAWKAFIWMGHAVRD